MKGSAGIILLNEYIPSEFQFNEMDTVDSRLFKQHMSKYAKKYPERFSKNIGKIARFGEKMAFSLGANVGPSDLIGDTTKTKKLISSLDKKLSLAKSDSKKRDILLHGLAEATEIAKKISPDNNEMAKQVRSGSRGKPVQFARMSVGPIYAVDMNQLPKTTLIKNNFTNGLSSHEYFNVASQGRFASVQAANATSEPGALGKVIIANTDDIKISMEDCNTTNGVFKSVTDPHILGHYTAGTNSVLITKEFLKKRNAGNRIKVRTPVTCAASKGVCIKCYGLKANGRLPHVGENVGIVAGQTQSEILTQMTISTKHSTMGKNESDKLTGVDGFKTIANSPESFSRAAVLAEDDGIISAIRKAPQGGTDIVLGRKKYYLSPSLKPIVKMGDKVSKGDRLSTGIITPKNVVKTRGLLEARQYESDSLHDIFKESTGQDLMKKHFDILARGHISLSKNKYGDTDSFEEHSRNYPKTDSEENVGFSSLGKYIARDVGTITKGIKINNRILNKLNEWGVKRIYVTTEEPKFNPIFKSLEQKPTFSGNLFQKMNYRNISKALIDEATQSRTPSYLNKKDSDRAAHTSGML